ncbi:MAG: preprotein translocase subunit SecE, partial [Clostridia bacterium]|nr:preprotein translocase subunit SecE [Clostridia bacterium]
LKKVSWPSFGKTVKQTGVVIAVVVICTLVLFGIDRLLSLLYKVLT